MSQVEVTIPSVGESITEATVGQWFFESGQWVEKDAVILEVETDKASVEVNAPASGALKIETPSGETVEIGAVIAYIDTAAEKPADAGTGSTQQEEKSSSDTATTASSAAPSTSGPQPTSEQLKGFGPARRKAIREGKEALPSASQATSMGGIEAPQIERKPMSVIRQKIAERLMQSQHGTATLTTFNEVDMSHILKLRSKLKEPFQERFGIKLGFMSFFTKALCAASKEVPAVNAYIEGKEIVYHQNVHVSVAVSTDRGLVVPVVRNADQLSYADIEKNIGELAEKARTGKLGIEEMMGGSITLTNGGVFGSLLSTPIINPPQSAILGMHKTEQRPMAVQDASGQWQIEIRPMMYLALSYDHRLIDGKDSVTFLVKAKEYLETVHEDQIMSS